jgi:cytochrome c-type biogenesis protein CcmE
MAQRTERLQRLRVIVLIVVFVVGLGLLLTRCPANRDGMPGQLAQSMDDATTAARSGALALDMWIQHRSTAQLTSVQLGDARDEVLKAYKGIADLRAEDPVDIGRQRMLTESMTAIIGQLNAALGTIGHVTREPSAETSRGDLLASADALESGYR